ncbi:hypothetical protein P280DRAFT_519345 [Massarina eburnea CBS 473.64]|uniref:Uncharacterized protein n=1 Tax=Massarina eburnea CBS 473.64 TaxID=1395130 RepID=A0A6A6RWK6_9PLEO|nr:hypothetical protein P280DRAFT_519345 [Massarina eburnea CBS 473.64]
MSAEETKALEFDSQAVNTLGIVGIVGIAAVFILILVIWTVCPIVKYIHMRYVQRRVGTSSDIESQPKTELEIDGKEIHRGICELEHPGMPELDGVSVMEMWEDGCAGEICGRGIVLRCGLDGGVRKPQRAYLVKRHTCDCLGYVDEESEQ